MHCSHIMPSHDALECMGISQDQLILMRFLNCITEMRKSGPSCSTLLTSLVNEMLKFQMY